MSNKIIAVDFQEKQWKYNPLVAWRETLAQDLEAHNYTTELSYELFPDVLVDDSPDLWTLNSRIIALSEGDKLVLFRNHHYEIRFYLSCERKLTLGVAPLATGIDAFLLDRKFEEEKYVIQKHVDMMLQIFGKDERND